VTNQRKQRTVLITLVLVYALLVLVSYLFFLDALMGSAQTALPATTMPSWLLGTATATLVLVIYGLAGLTSIWFARKLGIPAIYREGAGWRQLAGWPLVIGVCAGGVLVLLDWFFTQVLHQPPLPHPSFPFAIIASATAGIGEEILFRGFVMGLWAFLLNLLLRRWQRTALALWTANFIAALAFAASHLPAVMFLYDAQSPAELPPMLLVEIFLLNSLIALPAGWQSIKNGLIAAIGIHFWADIVWHVLWPLTH
jgi:membrane protease YdiL (CAAX protease family)